MNNICIYCYKKIRWFHAENKTYYQGTMKRMHDACAWKFLLQEAQKVQASMGIPRRCICFADTITNPNCPIHGKTV
jgi:hypothetical protein